MARITVSTISTSDPEYLRKAQEFIRNDLTRKKVDRPDILKTELLAEETIVIMSQHAPEGAPLHIMIKKLLGDVSITLSMPGEEFSPDPNIVGVNSEIDDDGNEDIIRAIFLRAFLDKYKYFHKRGTNKVRIIADKAGKTAIYLTLIALVLGLLFGLMLSTLFPASLSEPVCNYILQPFKTMFMNAIKIIVGPVVFFSLVTCFSQFKSLSELGKLAGKVMLVYMITTLIAVSLGFCVALLTQPGELGFALKSVSDVSTTNISTDYDFSLLNTLINIVPSNLLAPFLNSDTLQIMFLAVLVGVAAGMIGDYSNVLNEINEACNSLFLTITTLIAKLIPIAVFASVALMIYNLGGSAVFSVLESVGVTILAVFCMICVYGLAVMLIGRLNPIQFFNNIKEGMLTSFTLCSSSAAMPTNLKICVEKLGISPKLCNFSIPLGTTINMDGTSIYLAVTTVFLARAYDIQIDSSMLISLGFTIILLSLGAPGVPGCALVCEAVLIESLGLPIEAIGLIIAVNPITDMFDTMNNTTGDMAASLLVARSENMVDLDVFNSKK